ncbi:helix-turn-helix domain-containing protein [Aneurinibacillus aneurinilyticus]|uniref:helix-turn-helix domain-containing protein n=1 Tax=Aneurinibacillus aneurinilyticus TaxID=1391 RepID=UPI002E1E746A|nr:helix-turn-helix domain-containing protein [Aneurinibacillus aneurinilyticus]
MENLLGQLYSVTEVADMFKVDVNTVYLWLKEKKISAVKLGGTTWRIREQDLKLFILEAFEEGRK